ncbi:MAG: putative metal-binding motif-containing protein [Myxococcota bacterium]
MSRRQQHKILLILGLVAFSGCKAAKPDTEILLTITSPVGIDRLTVTARNIFGERSSVEEEFSTRDIRIDPFVILIRPSTIAVTDDTGFLVFAHGYSQGRVVVAGKQFLKFEDRRRVLVELRLFEDYTDADRDGFQDCQTRNDDPQCDCNDGNDQINPFVLESCNDNFDNNCSGYPPNEGCGCREDAICTSLPPEQWGLAGVGACAFGTLPCVVEPGKTEGAYLDTCVGAGEPSIEIVGDGIDNDCDGSVDEGGDCTPGETRPCFRGQIGAAMPPVFGLCQAGTQTCLPIGLWEDRCVNQIAPSRPQGSVGYAELRCDGLDEDCDGVFDEEPDFDTDADSYTICGTCKSEFLPAPSDKTQPWLCAEAIDCDDGDPLVNPGAMES